MSARQPYELRQAAFVYNKCSGTHAASRWQCGGAARRVDGDVLAVCCGAALQGKMRSATMR